MFSSWSWNSLQAGVQYSLLIHSTATLNSWQRRAETLISIGVKRAYGVPGDSLNGITDAIACVVFARNVEDPGDLEEAIRAAFHHAGPALLSVKVAKHKLSFPPTIDFEQAKGFGVP
jgi:thiamine pyrophosphate-dependent acetolactate synthase large subunit-like protein